MRNNRLSFVLPILLLSYAGPTYAQHQAIAHHEIQRLAVTLTGTVTDSVCGTDHGTRSVGDAACTRTCVELGAQYALAVGKKLYVLQGHEIDLERFAGSEVRIKGHTTGRDRVMVDQVDRLYTEAIAGLK